MVTLFGTEKTQEQRLHNLTSILKTSYKIRKVSDKGPSKMVLSRGCNL